MSCGLHAVLLLTLPFMLRMAPQGAAVEPDRSAGIVLVQQHDGQTQYFDQSQEENRGQQAASPSPSGDGALPSEEEARVDLAGVLPSATDPLGAARLRPAGRGRDNVRGSEESGCRRVGADAGVWAGGRGKSVRLCL